MTWGVWTLSKPTWFWNFIHSILDIARLRFRNVMFISFGTILPIFQVLQISQVFPIYEKSQDLLSLSYVMALQWFHIVLFSVHKIVSPKRCRFLEKRDFVFYFSSMPSVDQVAEDYKRPIELSPLYLKSVTMPLSNSLLPDEIPCPYYKCFQMELWIKASRCCCNWSSELSEP